MVMRVEEIERLEEGTKKGGGERFEDTIMIGRILLMLVLFFERPKTCGLLLPSVWHPSGWFDARHIDPSAMPMI
jgi:hypothetical protein